jgi:hypothetical protein
MWLVWQYPMFISHPALQAAGDITDGPFAWRIYRLADNANPADLQCGALGYAHEAKASYQDFLAARKAGELAQSIKFQVCLPTPYAVVTVFGRGQLERGTPPGLQDLQGELVARMKRLYEAVPQDVEVGVHLCYGDPDGRHLVEPRDASKEVEFANAIANAVTRPLTYLHMPMPINRFDEEFYRPVADLKLSPKTELYLGLVHPDGKENMRRRLDLADKYISGYGIASECGISRARTRETTMKFLQAYADNSREP